MHVLAPRVRMMRLLINSTDAPPCLVEYAYYVLLFYGIMGSALGLSVGMLGAGMLAVLAGFCVMRLGSSARAIYAPIIFPIGCAMSHIAVQLALHGESLMGDHVRDYVTWILALVVIQSLSVRKGFLHRFAFAALMIGLTTLPYLRVYEELDVLVYERTRLDSVVSLLSNPNGLGAWFGFCVVYFTIVGIESKRIVVRLAAWLVAIGCLFVTGLTVSRGPVFAIAIATIVAFRRLLKRGFIPVLFLILLIWISYESGLFERIAVFYEARGMQETGRFLIWPAAFERFLSSPQVGVGVSKVPTLVPTRPMKNTPHNSFLFIALASGIVPLLFYLGYWISAARKAFGSNTERSADAPFRIPLLIYAFVIAFILDEPFMFPWMIVTLSTAMAVEAQRRAAWTVVYRVLRRGTVRHSGHHGEVRHAVARYQR